MWYLAVPGAGLADLAGDVAGAVLRGDFSQAKAMVERGSDDPEAAGLRRSLQVAQQLNNRILSSFNVDQGQLVNLELVSGTEIVQVRQVEGNSVRVIRRVGTDEASEWTVTPDQLAASEKLKRLGGGPTGEINLLRGLVAFGGRDRDAALDYFRAASGDPLAGAIVDALSQGARQKAEAAARAELDRLLALAGMPASTALDRKSASEIRRRTFLEKDLGRIRSAAAAFRKKHAGTDVARVADIVVVELERVDIVTREIDVAMIDARIPKLKEANPALGDLKIERNVTSSGAEVSLAGNGGLKDVSAFGDLPFVRMDLSGSGVGDISPLRGMPLRELNLAGCPVTDLTPLLKLGQLEVLVLPSPSADVAPLKGHRGLKRIGYSADALESAAAFWAKGSQR